MSRLINWALHDLMLDYREIMLMGEAAALPFFSRGQYTNPMVVRIAGLGYQQGFGGHFLNGNSVAVLRDIPGLILACPSNGTDLAIVSFASGFYLSRQAHKDLGTGIRVIDLRWLNPLPLEAMIEAVRPAGRSSLLTRPGGPGHFGDGNDGASETVMTALAEAGRHAARLAKGQ